MKEVARTNNGKNSKISLSGVIEDIAKKWLSEPAYTNVFKHTAVVIEDYLCYFLTAVGAIALSIRFLSSLGTGDLSCIITGDKACGLLGAVSKLCYIHTYDMICLQSMWLASYM